MNKALKNNILEIANKIKDSYHPQKIVLFGSAVRGEFEAGSDIDFLIVKNSHKPMHKRVVDVFRLLRGINSAIKILSRYVPRETDIYEKEDFTNFETLQKKNLKDKILELVKQGKTLAAIRIVMQAYNWNTTQATEFVKKLLE